MFAFIIAQNKILESKFILYLRAEHGSGAILFLRGKKAMFFQYRKIKTSMSVLNVKVC